MKIAHVSINMWSLGGLWAAMLCLGQVGCVVTYTTTAVPAARLPAIYQAEPKCGKVPVNFTLLRQEPPKEYLLGPGDQVGVFVKNLVPGGAEPPMVQQAMSTTAEVYPARGLINTPNVGIPYSVNNDGTLILPKVEPVNVAGKTVSQAAATILEAYKATGLLAAGKEEAFVSLLRPRVNRVMVLREDVQANSPQFITKNILPYTRRGTGEVIDLPAYENDVLHVLAASGGLPGIETYNHVWVLKSTSGDRAAEEAQTRIQNGEDAEQVFRALDAKRTAIRIPLRVKPGEPLSFGPQDVILHQGVAWPSGSRSASPRSETKPL